MTDIREIAPFAGRTPSRSGTSRRVILTGAALGLIGAVHEHAAIAEEIPDKGVADLIPAGFSSRMADVGPVRIHYVIGGSGPPLLLIHGWPETWYEWRKVMPLLAKRFTVIAVDLRGIGDSSPASTGYDKKTLAQDLHSLMQGLGHPRAIVVGHDWGGPVGYAYAAQFREAVEQLVLVEGSPFGPWVKDPDLAWFFVFLREPGYAESLLPGREHAFLRWFYTNKAQHVVPVFDEAVIKVYSDAYARPGRMAASYGLYRTIDQDIADNAIFAAKPLAIPVLAIGAEKGAGPAHAINARAVATNVTAVLFRDTGHFVPEERPEALSATILAFLDGKPVAPEYTP